MIVILDVICLIFSPFYGQIRFEAVSGVLLFINMLGTCILYQSFLLSRGEYGFDLNTEKIVYYPTTRKRFLINKYSKTLIFIIIQLTLTILCLGLGKLSSRGEMENSRFLNGCLIVFIGILITSGVSILVIHLTPFGVYIPMILFYPLLTLMIWLESLGEQRKLTEYYQVALSLSIAAIAVLLWLLLLWVGIKIYEKVA